MASETSNDNTGPPAGPPVPDAHGQAALLLVESLIHGLIARKVIDVVDAVDIIDIASEVRADMAVDSGEPPATVRRSLGLIQSIGSSLSRDLPRG